MKTNKFGITGGFLSALLLSCFMYVQPAFAQQKPMFSQYMFNMLNINPAYAGNRRTMNLTGLYRNQWVGIEGAPSTVSFSFDQRKENSNVGYGLQFFDDKIGIERSTGVQGFYAYHIPFQNSSLSIGLNAGLMNYSADYQRVTTIQPNDPTFLMSLRGWLPTFGAGVLYSRPKWYAGISVPDMLKTKLTQGRADISSASPFLHFFVTAGFIKNINDQVTLKPSVLLKSVGGAPLQADVNVNVWFNNYFSIGASYRTGDAVVGLAELQATPQIRIGYGYDHTISKLAAYSRGTHELMLRFELGSKSNDDVVSPRYY